jgi:hypothetical protein
MYQFKTGEKTKFKTFSDYTTRGLNLWTWLIVDESNAFSSKVHLAEDPAVSFDVLTKVLEEPIGFKEVYQVIVDDPEKKDQVLSWLQSRGGISVWCSHDLSTPGRYMYSPGDKSQNKPHWSMGIVEVVTDPARIEIHLEVTRANKPPKEEKHKWKYDRRMREWYRLMQLFPA